MSLTINMSYISIIILVVIAIQATNAAAVDAKKKFDPSFQPGKVHKIIGGTPATLGEIPYQVEILKNNGYWCGGSLLSTTRVVTAAHCLSGVKENEIIVRAGHISHSNPGSTAQTKSVKNIKIHEMYNSTSLRNDIGLLELTSAMQINKFVKTIALPCQDCTTGVNQVLLASGWGKTENENSSPVLMKVDLNAVPQTKCNEQWGGFITSGMKCAGTKGNSTCFGDSGGPLATKSGKITLVGTTSFGTQTCNTNARPSVFTNVAKYIGWIN